MAIQFLLTQLVTQLVKKERNLNSSLSDCGTQAIVRNVDTIWRAMGHYGRHVEELGSLFRKFSLEAMWRVDQRQPGRKGGNQLGVYHKKMMWE